MPIDRREFLLATGILAGGSTAEIGVGGAPLVRAGSARVRVLGLKTDYLAEPLGLENPAPRLSWQLQSESRNVRQSAYRILVASSEAMLKAGRGDLWDSGQVQSSQSFGIDYDGRELRSRQRCWWRVQVWDERDDVASTSEIARWEMGLLKPADWSAQWLAVEDERTRADREAGMPWLWAPPSLATKSGPWIFRLEIPVFEPTAGGEFFASINDWHWWTQITRIWVDDEPVFGTGAWTSWRDSKVYDRPGGLNHLDHQTLPLPAWNTGRHSIAIEITTGESEIIEQLFSEVDRPVPAIALFARLDEASGRSVRYGRGAPWTVGLSPTAEDFRPALDARRGPPAALVKLDAFEPWPERPARWLRKAFSIDKAIARARLYATALGAYEARLNGVRVGDALLTPEPAQYNTRALYQIRDVTAQLHAGENVLGLIVGEGWYGGFDGRFAYAPPPLRALAQLEIEYADGTWEVVATGPGWRSAESPIRSSAIKVGEVYDARLEQAGWDAPGFNDQGWSAVGLADALAITLTPQLSPPVRETETLRAQKISEVRPHVYVADFGRMFAGRCRLRTSGQAGQTIELKFAQALKTSGEVDQSHGVIDPTLAPRTDQFILRGDPKGEVFEPRFTYRSFRYVEISGLQMPLTPDALDGVVIHTDLKRTGQLHCSEPLVEQIDVLLDNTLRANYVAIPVDNNIREMRGYFNDATCFWETAAFHRDTAAFTRRIMDNASDRQTAAGMFPKNGPEPPHGNAFYNMSMNPPGHATGGILLPWKAWRQYGDTAIIDRFWEPMSRFLALIEKDNPDHLWSRHHANEMSDWLEGDGIPEKMRAPLVPIPLFATAYWATCVDKMAAMAEATAREAEAIRLRALQRRIVEAFNRAYVKADGTLGSGSQTCYVLALHFGLLPEPLRPRAAERLVAEIARCGQAITTGTLATEFILDVLVDNGYSKLACDLLLRTEIPSWGYMVRRGATGVWETWGNQRAESQPALGCIGGFLYRRIAGIAAAEPGFKSIVIDPVLDPCLRKGGGDYDSVMGRISTNWEQHEDGVFTLDVIIPANASASVHLPASPTARIYERRRPITNHPDIRQTARSNRKAKLEMGSGRYTFRVEV